MFLSVRGGTTLTVRGEKLKVVEKATVEITMGYKSSGVVVFEEVVEEASAVVLVQSQGAKIDYAQNYSPSSFHCIDSYDLHFLYA